MSESTKDLIKRAAHTAWQAAAAYLLTAGSAALAGVNDMDAAKTAAITLAVGCIGAALSALKTFALNEIQKQQDADKLLESED